MQSQAISRTPAVFIAVDPSTARKVRKICPESYAETAKDPRKNARAELGVLGRRATWENAKKPAIPTDKGAVGGKFAPTGHSRTTIQLSLRWSLFFNHTVFDIDNNK